MKISNSSQNMLITGAKGILTSGGVAQFNNIETLAANGTAVGPFDPRFQTVIMEIMSAGK